MKETHRTNRKDRPVLGKKRFDVTHHEPVLSQEGKAERLQCLANDLYPVFRDILYHGRKED